VVIRSSGAPGRQLVDAAAQMQTVLDAWAHWDGMGLR
jgi:hypothetical protein